MVHISARNCVDGPSSGSRDDVEARELNDGAANFVDAVEGRADLDVLPGIFFPCLSMAKENWPIH